MSNRKKLSTMFSMVWHISPAYVFLLLADALSHGLQIWANVILPKFLIDEITGAKNPNQLIMWGGLIVGGNLVLFFLSKTLKRLMDVKKAYLQQSVDRVLAEKIMNISYGHLEDPYYLDLKERATFAMKSQDAAAGMVQNLGEVVKQGITVLGLVAVMLQLSFVLVVMLLVTIVLMLLIQLRFSRYQTAFFKDLIPVNRKLGYYIGVTFEDYPQKDFRLYHMAPMLGDQITAYNKHIQNWFTKYHHKEGLYMGLYQIVMALQTALAYGYVGARCIVDLGQGILGIGSLTMYVNSAIQFSNAIVKLGESFVGMGQKLNFLEPLTELMSLPDQEADGGTKVLLAIDTITFEGVTFAYPKTDKTILDNITFTIDKGQKISIVGLNGAGKSTIVKLLCRLYKPDSGKIMINGIDIFDYDYTSYMEQLAAVFQDFKLFNFSIEENITCQPVGQDTVTAEHMIDQVGLREKVQALPQGLQTRMGKAYDKDGTELSGGQEQKIAIARALYKNASLIVLDEPTSALDPIAEAEIYEKFNAMVGDKTALYISHRMSSSVFCDKILVLNQGKIESFDTHQNLMQNTDSLYYTLFSSQAVNYTV